MVRESRYRRHTTPLGGNRMTQPYSDAPAPGPEPTPSPTPHGSSSPALPDLRSLPPFDLGILIAGVLIFIVSFFPWYGVSSSGASVGGFKVPGINASENAWHSYSVLALLLLLLATAVAAVAIFASGSAPQLPIGLRWIAAGPLGAGRPAVRDPGVYAPAPQHRHRWLQCLGRSEVGRVAAPGRRARARRVFGDQRAEQRRAGSLATRRSIDGTACRLTPAQPRSSAASRSRMYCVVRRSA
jgi:hypothetical protein